MMSKLKDFFSTPPITGGLWGTVDRLWGAVDKLWGALDRMHPILEGMQETDRLVAKAVGELQAAYQKVSTNHGEHLADVLDRVAALESRIAWLELENSVLLDEAAKEAGNDE